MGDSHEVAMNNVMEKIKLSTDYLGDKDYLIGDYITLVDFIYLEIIEFCSWLWEDIYDTYPKLKAYYQRMVSIPQIESVLNSDTIPKQFLPAIAKINNLVADVEVITEK